MAECSGWIQFSFLSPPTVAKIMMSNMKITRREKKHTLLSLPLISAQGLEQSCWASTAATLGIRRSWARDLPYRQLYPNPTSCPNHQEGLSQGCHSLRWQETCLAQFTASLPFSQAGNEQFRIPCPGIWEESNPLCLHPMIHSGLPERASCWFSILISFLNTLKKEFLVLSLGQWFSTSLTL